MLKWLGNIIEKRPWLVISLVLLITIGFSILIPSVKIRTDFKDFMPDDEIVKANQRVVKTFGESQQMMFLYMEKQLSESSITPQALREQQYIEKELLKLNEVRESLSILTVIEQICQLEFGDIMENCTDEQIAIAVQDLLMDKAPREIQIFDVNDLNEEIDYNRNQIFSKSKSIDEIDVKNCYVSYDDETITFSIEVYDLSKFEDKMISPIPLVNVVEWYVDFENIVKPHETLDIDYRIAAHLEPKHPLWEIGIGPLKNLRAILEHIKNGELFNTYKKEAYLWVKPPGQDIYFPLLLETGKVNFDVKKNLVEIKASREELGNYGIALRYGFFELPAKLTNFKAGTRYYQTSILKLPWFRVTVNTNYLLNKLEKIRNSPVLGNIAGRLLKIFANLSWEDYDKLMEDLGENIPLPDQIALKEMETSWINSDVAPDKGVSENILFIRTPLYDEVKTSALAFLSKDLEVTKKPKASIMILNLNISWRYEDQVKSNKFILEKLEEIDAANDFISVEATGDGVVSVQIDEVTMEANKIIMPMIFITIIIVLFVFFRRVTYVILPLSALVVATIWIFGTMVLLGIPFTTMSVAIVPLIMGLGVDYSVHLSHNYRLELSKGRTPAEAIKISVFEIGTAMFLAMLTTVIAFLSFLSASVPPLRDLGLILALGILYTFLTAITLQAAVRYLVDRRKEKFKKIKKQKFKLNILMGKLAKTILGHQKKILGVFLLITLIGAVGASQIETGFDFYSFVPKENPAIHVFTKMEENFPYVGQDYEYILFEGDVADVDTLKSIMKTHENLEDDTFISRSAKGTPRAESIYIIINQAVNNNLSLIEVFNLDEKTRIPRTDRDVRRLYDFLWDSLEYGIQTQYSVHKTRTGRYDAAIIRVYIDVLASGRETVDFEKDLRVMTKELNDDVENYGGADVVVTGPFVITHKITSSLKESQLISTGISLFLATIVLIIAYRKLTLGLIAIIPVLISIVWILGTMYFIGYSLNILTIMVTSLTIGIGIDYAIHATERFKLVADKTGDINAALTETISRTGGALLIAALTTTLGFGMLVFAPIPPQVQFGVIMLMTIAFSFITSVLLLPLVLARWAKWTKKRKGYIISPKPAEKDYLDDVKSK